MRALSALPVVCLLVLIPQAREAAAAGVCPSQHELQTIINCWGTLDVGDISRCSAPWSMKQVRHCIDSAVGAFSEDPTLDNSCHIPSGIRCILVRRAALRRRKRYSI